MADNFFSNINVAPGFVAKSKGNKNQFNRKLIIIQLGGGNDGLNTVIPFKNQAYYKNRRNIAIPKSKQIVMDDDIAFHHALKEFSDLFNQGQVQVINDVGYPNRTRSHFKSMDIWQSANAENSKKNTGWLGRYLDATCNNAYHNMFRAVQISDILSLALKGEQVEGIAFDDFNELMSDLKQTNVEGLLSHVENDAFKQNDNLNYIYNLMYEGNQIIQPIYEKYKKHNFNLSFPSSRLGKDLQKVARLILCDINTQIYYVNHGTFDTHSNQLKRHTQLLTYFSKALNSFVATLKENNKFDEVCILVFSEFGRRVAENASLGTDHGTANNLFLISNHFKAPGFYNAVTDFQNLIQGDLDYKIDFRRIYASILEDWLLVDSAPILMQKFDKLDIFNNTMFV